MKRCFSCGRVLDISGRVGRGDECPGCTADLRACRNCAFYDPASSKQCKEPQAELVKEKDRANYCEFFVFREDGAGEAGRGEDPLAKLKGLFKG